MPSRRGASIALARILEAGGNIGALVDQTFQNGVRTTFFGRPCETSPLHPQARPAIRLRRLPGPLHAPARQPLPPRAGGEARRCRATRDGKVDVAATAQLLNDVVERWIREDPGQWMWFHKRWKLSPPRAEPARERRPTSLRSNSSRRGALRRRTASARRSPRRDGKAQRDKACSAAGQPGSARRISSRTTIRPGRRRPPRMRSSPVSAHACGRRENPFRWSDSSR